MIKLARGENYVKLTLNLTTSAAWCAQGINVRRFIDFLITEHLRKGGKANGKLKAPHRQLEAWGIGARHVAHAIREAEELGLVDSIRGGMRVATIYTLTWLPLHDDSEPSNRWRDYPNPRPSPAAQTRRHKGKADQTEPTQFNLPSKGKADGASVICLPRVRQITEGSSNLPSERGATLPSDGGADVDDLPSESETEASENLPSEGEAPSRRLYQGADEILGEGNRVGPSAVRGPSAPLASGMIARAEW